MLQDVIRLGTGRKALALNRTDLAGKTGTTNDYVDAWFSGFNPDLTTTVWIGYDDPKPMGRGEAGSSTALPIWVDYMQYALSEVPNREWAMPPEIEEVWINKETLAVSAEGEPWAIKEYFLKDSSKLEFDPLSDEGADLTLGIGTEQNVFQSGQTNELQDGDDANPSADLVLPQTQDQSINTDGLF
jgi:penicillin-binding protein 1A